MDEILPRRPYLLRSREDLRARQGLGVAAIGRLSTRAADHEDAGASRGQPGKPGLLARMECTKVLGPLQDTWMQLQWLRSR